MAVRKLVQVSPERLDKAGRATESLLGEPCEEVVSFDANLADLVTDLTDTLFAHPVAIGLAAPQIGSAQCVAVVNVEREDPAETIVLINPELLSATGKKDTKRESCMSLPDFAGEVVRKTKVSVRFQKLDGKSTHLQVEGFVARVIQHEVDHLEGILYTGRMASDAMLVPTDIFSYDAPQTED